MAMLLSNRALQSGFVLAAAGLLALYAAFGEPVPPARWTVVDIVGEGGVALLAAIWLWIVLASRPAGRVTLRLALGLAGVSLGAWCDALDEFFSVQTAWAFDNWLESTLMPLGMAMLTWGLIGWRREQFQLSEHMAQRERLFRDHRAFDRITELADADYLRDQLALEQQRSPSRAAALVMVEVCDLAALVREHGRRDGVRALRTVTHQLLLNLRHDDLLCRYAGDRFLILLPQTLQAEAEHTAAHLRRMVRATVFHPRGGGARVGLDLRHAVLPALGEPDVLLEALNRALEPVPAQAAAMPC